MRVCIVYDCLFPYTVGGAERWYRNLAERLLGAGHEVTYLTLRQWTDDVSRHPVGVTVVAVGPRLALYRAGGQRRLAPPLVFGLGVFWWLATHGRRVDVVHSASFPYFSLLAARLIRPFAGFRIVVDWHEFWSRDYWLSYAGAVVGRVGWAIQALCLRVPQAAFCFARLTAGRLRAHGLNGDVVVLEGEYAGPLDPPTTRPATPLVLFAGRQIPEKRPRAVVAAIDLARRQIPGLRGLILGDGPEHAAVLADIDRLGLADIVDAPGFVAIEVVEHSLQTALCLLAPSSREGYGLVVVEAAAASLPCILVEGEDNAATELIEQGVNGYVVDNASAEALSAAIVRTHAAGDALRGSTHDWFARNAQRLSLESSLARVLESYAVKT